MKYEGIIISDIHFGAFDSSILMEELYGVYIKYLEHLKVIDFIVITGDYFDHKIYLNERVSKHAVEFMDRLVGIAKTNHCPIRIVYGTESHEVNQYNIFSIYEDDPTVDFKVITSVMDEDLLPDMRVLYLPEEYIFSKKEYYKDYLDNEEAYDYIFGHGVIQEVMTEASRSTKEKNGEKRQHVPIFTTSELIHMCKGQVYFGHYHINTNIMDKIFYVGSYSRWMFGEEEAKGFYHTTFDTKKDTYKQKFIENELARRYTTYTYGYQSKAISDEESLLEELSRRDKVIEETQKDHVRFVFNIPEDHPNPEFIMKVLNERYRFNNSVKVNVTNGYVDKKKAVNKKSLAQALTDYPLIFDKSVKIENKIEYFIKKKYGREIDLDKIKRYLYQEN